MIYQCSRNHRGHKSLNCNPWTCCPVLSTTLSSSSCRLRGIGRIIGLARSMLFDRIVGLLVLFIIRGKGGYGPDTVGDEAAELTTEVGIWRGIAIGPLEVPPRLMGEFVVE